VLLSELGGQLPSLPPPGYAPVFRLFNLIFWIPNSFRTFLYYGRGGTPSVASKWRHVTDFLSFRILNNLRLPWNFSLCWNIFYHSEIWTTYTCPENRVCPEMFHCVEYTFHIQDFWATCALSEFTVLNIYFLSFRNLKNLRLPWKTEFSLKIFTAFKYIYLSGFLNNLRLPWKQSLPWKFSLYWI